MTSRLGNRQKLKKGMSLSNLSIVAFRAAKVPTNVFSSILIFHLTLDNKSWKPTEKHVVFYFNQIKTGIEIFSKNCQVAFGFE